MSYANYIRLESSLKERTGARRPDGGFAVKRSLLMMTAILLFATAICAAGVDMAVSTAWLADHQKDAGLIVLHVGVDRKAYDAGHVPGARFVQMSDITLVRSGVPNQTPSAEDIKKTFERLGVGDGSTVIAYGDGPLLASEVYFLLDYVGHQNHAILDGGLAKWKAEKREVTAVVPEFKPATLTVKAHPELLVDFAAMQKIVADKSPLVLDSRPPEQYSGATAGDAVVRAGHIPGAKNVFWQKTLTADGELKPVNEIRAAYEAAGVKPGSQVIAYCRTGMMAKHTYFTLKMAGFKPVVYDASFMEWSKTDTAKVVTGADANCCF